MKDKKLWLKAICYLLVLTVLYIFQSTRGLGVHIGSSSVDLLPFFIMTVALFEGPYFGGIFGFIAGVFASLNSGVIEGLYSLYYALCAIGFGWYSQSYLRKLWFSSILGGAACFALRELIGLTFYYWLFLNLPLTLTAQSSAISLALSLPFSYLAYFSVKLIHTKLGTENEE